MEESIEELPHSQPLGETMSTYLNAPAPGEIAPRESRTAQFYQATEPDQAARHARLLAYTEKEWTKPPVGEDGPEYREPRSWRDNPLYNRF